MLDRNYRLWRSESDHCLLLGKYKNRKFTLKCTGKHELSNEYIGRVPDRQHNGYTGKTKSQTENKIPAQCNSYGYWVYSRFSAQPINQNLIPASESVPGNKSRQLSLHYRLGHKLLENKNI